MLTAEDIRLILSLIAEKHGPGYAADREVGQLQAKLSMMLEAKARVGGL